MESFVPKMLILCCVLPLWSCQNEPPELRTLAEEFRAPLRERMLRSSTAPNFGHLMWNFRRLDRHQRLGARLDAYPDASLAAEIRDSIGREVPFLRSVLARSASYRWTEPALPPLDSVRLLVDYLRTYDDLLPPRTADTLYVQTLDGYRRQPPERTAPPQRRALQEWLGYLNYRRRAER